VRALVAVLLTLLLVSACSDDPDPVAGSTAVSTSTPTKSSTPQRQVPLDDLHVVCTDNRDPAWAQAHVPTVVLVSGLNTSGEVFTDLAERVSNRARACWYDRAGIGASPPLPDGTPDPSPGSAAADLHASLRAQGIRPPYVMLGWSYGGLVAQAYALAHPRALQGLILEDSSVREQFTDPLLLQTDEDVGVHWAEGGREIDIDALQAELAELDFGDVRLLVLSQDAQGAWGEAWLRYHDELARASSDGTHVVGRGSGHVMHEDVPELVELAVEDVLMNIVGGLYQQGSGCDDVGYTGLGWDCRDL
jgi:pimeloyl-ACP methyl ester carboxylesterase